MHITPVTPAKSLPPAYRAQSLGRASMDAFKKQFRLLVTRIAEAGNESEEQQPKLQNNHPAFFLIIMLLATIATCGVVIATLLGY